MKTILMNTTMFKAVCAFGLLACSLTASHARTTQYVADNNQNYNVISDGRNTYIEAVPGLIVKGATADGDRLIVAGTPSRIYGNHGGRPLVMTRADTLVDRTPDISASSSPSLNSRISNIESALKAKEAQLVAQGVTPTVGTTTKAVNQSSSYTPAAVSTQTWEIKRSDATLFGALTRWTETASPKRQLVFATEGNDFPADQEASFSGDFDTAIANVMESFKHSSYPLRVCLWDNKPRPVVKVIHKNKRCED